VNEIRALTGIRGIAALTVFLAHTREALVPRGVQLPVSTLAERLFLSGGRQVDIFFVLSGFILSLIYASWFSQGVGRDSYFRFLRKRFARIYPLQAFMLSLIAAFVVAAHFAHAEVFNGLGRFTLSTLAQNYLLVHAWGFAGGDGGPWNPPSWSISIETMAYLVLPVFLWGTAAVRRSHPWLLLLGSIACGFLLNAVVFWGETGLEGVSRGLSEFALGSVIASFFNSTPAAWLRSNIGSTVALAGLLVCFALTPNTGFAIAVFAAPLLLALSGKNYVSAFFGSTPVYFLGEISYSVYLGHFLFTSIAYRLISTQWMRTSWFATCVGVSFIVVLGMGHWTVN
jgi:peptidoglycan/LPS O-acetylase OafA/YrhL